ncbi:MAG TPA: type IV pilus assembly protein PilM [Candidatus Saccharimonadales bacterium]|nr:type IV pilus assembly protein PilM [Candidatus Saccharimonadales bacterium]
MPGFFHKDKPISGVDISTTGIKIMAIDPTKMRVLGFGMVDLDPTKVQASLTEGDDYLVEGLKKLLRDNLIGTLPSSHVVASVLTSRTYSRTVSVPLNVQNIAEAVQLEAEQYIPIPLSELYTDYDVIEVTKKEQTVLLSAVPKKIVDAVTSTCQKAGLEVVMVEPAINAAARLIRATEEGHLPSILVDIGAATSDIGLMDGGVVRLTGSAAVGGHTFTYKIAEKLKVSLEEAHQLKVHSGLASGAHQAKMQAALDGLVGEIVSEVRKIIRYYNERVGVKTKIQQIIITGGGSNMPGLGDAITDAMMMPARVAEPWNDVTFGRLHPPAKQLKPRYTTAAGLSLVNPKEVD